ncbi:MAG: TPM domain-containing protein [Candidatus Electrothrix sp. EH2]|nr:TPM domain-containing protein [Candidatus Electrothrix sp. EH2]
MWWLSSYHLFIKSAWPVCFTLLAVLLCYAAPAYSAYPQPVSGKRVYDFSSLLSAEQEAQLEQLTSGVAKATTAELDIVTVSSLHGETIEEYANNLFNEWGIGRADTNNGVLFLIAPNERRVRIEVGYGLEPLLTDGLCGDIIAKNIIPAFKAGNFDEGIISGAERIAEILLQNPEQAQGVKDSAPKFLRKVKGVKDDVLNSLTEEDKMFILLLYPFFLAVFLMVVLFFVQSQRKYPIFLAIVTGLATLSFVFLGKYACGFFFFSSLFVLPLAKMNYAKFIRFRPPRCKTCGKRMIAMSKEEIKDVLDNGEKKEEELGSVEYDV